MDKVFYKPFQNSLFYNFLQINFVLGKAIESIFVILVIAKNAK